MAGLSDAVSIRERPAEVEDRAVPGHWEGDLLFGSNNSQIATLVERHTRYVMIARVPRQRHRDGDQCPHQSKPTSYHGSSTSRSPGIEAKKWRITNASLWTLNIKVYFCDPQSPWQRGSNENTNGLLRQYFPKGMDLSNVHQNRLNAVAQTT